MESRPAALVAAMPVTDGYFDGVSPTSGSEYAAGGALTQCGWKAAYHLSGKLLASTCVQGVYLRGRRLHTAPASASVQKP